MNDIETFTQVIPRIVISMGTFIQVIPRVVNDIKTFTQVIPRIVINMGTFPKLFILLWIISEISPGYHNKVNNMETFFLQLFQSCEVFGSILILTCELLMWEHFLKKEHFSCNVI